MKTISFEGSFLQKRSAPDHSAMGTMQPCHVCLAQITAIGSANSHDPTGTKTGVTNFFDFEVLFPSSSQNNFNFLLV